MIIKCYGHSDDCFEIDIVDSHGINECETNDLIVNVLPKAPVKKIVCPDCNHEFIDTENDQNAIIKLVASYDHMWTFGYEGEMPNGWDMSYIPISNGMVMVIDTHDDEIMILDSKGVVQ